MFLLNRGVHSHKISMPSIDLGSKDVHRNAPDLRLIHPKGEITPGLLRVWLKSPWANYDAVGRRSLSGGVALAHRKSGYFSKAAIRAFPGPGSVSMLQRLSNIRHPNLASIYDVYSYKGNIFVATEYLEITLKELGFDQFLLQEWEIATIIAEVWLFHDTLVQS